MDRKTHNRKGDITCVFLFLVPLYMRFHHNGNIEIVEIDDFGDVYLPRTFTFISDGEEGSLNEIEKLAGKLLLTGKSEQIYAPSSAVKRSDFTTMLVEALGLKSLPLTNQFKDTKGDAWYARFISCGLKAGLVHGVTKSAFNPDDSIIRTQMAVMIERAMNWS